MADTGSEIVSSDNIPNNMKSNHQEKPSNPVSEVEFQVSQVIGRLEEAVIGKNPPSLQGTEAQASDTIDKVPDVRVDNTVMHQIEELFLRDPEDGELVPLPELTSTSRMSIISHAIGALSGSMERNHVAHISSKISSETTKFIDDLVRCEGYGVCYHDDQLEGVVRIVRALLHSKIPHFTEQGFLAFKNKLPTIYTSVSAPLGIVQHLCRQLALPLTCVNAIPCNTLFGPQKMDLAALEREIESDKEGGSKIPLIVLADAGTPIGGHVDNILRLQEICKANGVWLHLRGHCLAALAVPESSSAVSPICDSMTLPLGIWLGIPGLPTATVYNQKSLIPGAVSMLDHPGRKLISLPLWAAFQSLGKEEIRRRFRVAFDWCHQLWQRLQKYPNIRLLSQAPGGQGGLQTITELSSKPVNPTALFEIAACTVVFQFVPENVEGRAPPYYDKLNSWLGQMLQRDCPQVNITFCEVEHGEVVLRYCPLEPLPTDQEPPDFDLFVSCLEQQIEILAATVHHKGVFQKLVEASPVLRLVEVDGWAGLGGVRYQPASCEDVPLNDILKHQLNKLNVNLVEKLRATDSAFSLGEGGDGLVCVRFGMVTSDTDVAELLGLVVTAGQEEEENDKALDNMAEVVKKGIETVTLELQKESDEQIWQDGILRSVPVVGSFVNWWSPNSKPSSGIKGRSLDLNAGIVASTENIYRYHMQTSPNQPIQQTSVGHSRSSSSSSSQPVPQP